MIKELRLDMQRIKPLVLREATRALQEHFGRPVSSVKAGQIDPEFLWALAYATGRLMDPELSWEEAGLIDLELVVAEIPPTNGGGSKRKRP